MYRRVSDCSHAPVSSCVGSKVFLIDRKTDDYGWTFKLVKLIDRHAKLIFLFPTPFIPGLRQKKKNVSTWGLSII